MTLYAFPTHDENYSKNYSGPGMTLRDYFAAVAVQSVSCGIIAEGFTDNEGAPFRLARAAYEIADAMLAAREGGAA